MRRYNRSSIDMRFPFLFQKENENWKFGNPNTYQIPNDRIGKNRSERLCQEVLITEETKHHSNVLR